MKKLLLVAACMVATVGALAQGQVNFANKVGTTVDARVFDADGTTALNGAFEAQLYVGLDAGSLAAVGSPIAFRASPAAANGYWAGAIVTTPFKGGTAVIAEVRAWEIAGGATYEAALAAGKKTGKSNDITVTVTEAPNTPPDLVGLKSFTLVPEPSTIALGILGAAALLLRRRQ